MGYHKSIRLFEKQISIGDTLTVRSDLALHVAYGGQYAVNEMVQIAGAPVTVESIRVCSDNTISFTLLECGWTWTPEMFADFI